LVCEESGETKMNPNFDPHMDSGQQDTREMDNLQRLRFELLSAYLDGEVTADERKQVQHWLATDPQVQRQYAKMLKLRQGIQTLPVPAAEQPAQQIAQQVFARIDRHRNRRLIAWGGAAIAALFMGALSGVMPQSPAPQVATNLSPQKVAPQPLMVALNEPVIPIPKAAIAAPEKSLTSSSSSAQ
jgi:anti-sigma factor RsiW